MLKDEFTNLCNRYGLTPEERNELGKLTFMGNDNIEAAAKEIASRPRPLPLNMRPGFAETDRGRKEAARQQAS
jgi:hypothetical protein